VLASSEDAGAGANVSRITSDIRLKRDVGALGQHANGINLYRFRYLWSDTVHVGVVAQEVAAARPDAVRQGADGYLRVDYARLGLRMQTWDQWTAAH
jgi:Chaperone of endosialidase